MRLAPAVLPAFGLVALLAFQSGCGPPESAGPAAAASASSDHKANGEGTLGLSSTLGDGFLVWESNRTGNWRLWTRELAPSPPRQLTPDEPARQHCCAHVSPDGAWIAYLSFPDAMAGYAAGGSEGVLHLIRPDGSGGRGPGRRRALLVGKPRGRVAQRSRVDLHSRRPRDGAS